MKIIELIDMIADKEKTPLKLKYHDNIYCYCDLDYYCKENNDWLLSGDFGKIMLDLYEELEIVDEELCTCCGGYHFSEEDNKVAQKEIDRLSVPKQNNIFDYYEYDKIKKGLEFSVSSVGYDCDEMIDNFININKKFNEIIDYLNAINEKTKDINNEEKK